TLYAGFFFSDFMRWHSSCSQVKLRTFLCTHAMPYEDTTTEQCVYWSARSTECTAHINVSRSGVVEFHLIVKAAGKHDHAINEHQRYSRQMNDPSILQDVAATARPAPKRTASYPTSDPRRSATDRTLAVLGEFMESRARNPSKLIMNNDSNMLCWSPRPNVNQYKLLRFAVHDVLDRGQYVQHALVQTEAKADLSLAVSAFTKTNPEWAKIQAVMADWTLHEKDMLHEAWPNARQLLVAKKTLFSIGWEPEDENKAAEGLVNSESEQNNRNTISRTHFWRQLETIKKSICTNFIQHWDSTTGEEVMYNRGGVPHLKTHTNNRLEQKWGRIKEVVDGNFTIDELVFIAYHVAGVFRRTTPRRLQWGGAADLLYQITRHRQDY
ncbi:hypothetical protein GN958_ATG20295, partial [Phytophthora infestans]